MGWVQKSRNKGGIIFMDLKGSHRHHSDYFRGERLRGRELCKGRALKKRVYIAVTGVVEKRSGAANENLKTGSIEVRANSLRILSESETPPFPIEENSKTKEELRLKYRYLDLRRPDLQRNLMTRSRVTTAAPEAFWQRRDSWRSRLRLSSRVRRREPETTLCPAVCIQAASMPFPSLRSSLSSC